MFLLNVQSNTDNANNGPRKQLNKSGVSLYRLSFINPLSSRAPDVEVRFYPGIYQLLIAPEYSGYNSETAGAFEKVNED